MTHLIFRRVGVKPKMRRDKRGWGEEKKVYQSLVAAPLCTYT